MTYDIFGPTSSMGWKKYVWEVYKQPTVFFFKYFCVVYIEPFFL